MWRCISVVVVVVVLTALSVCVYVPFGFGGVSTTFSLFSCVAKCFLYVCVDFFQLSSQFLSGISNSSERVQSFDINNRSFSFVFVFKLTLFCFTFNCSVFLVCLYIFVSVFSSIYIS